MASGNYFGTNGQLQPDILSGGRQFNSQTISSGAITYTYTLAALSAESGTTDDLTTISSADAGDIIIIKAASGHTITAKTTGNIAISADYEISGDTTLTLVYDGSNWCPLGSGAGGGSSDNSVDYGFVRRNTTTLSISNTTYTLVQFDTAHDDQTSMWDGANYWFVIANGGVYHYEFNIHWANNSTGRRIVLVQLYDVASSTDDHFDYTALGSSINGNSLYGSQMSGSGSAYIPTNYKIGLRVYQNSGGSLNLLGTNVSNNYRSYFKIARIGARAT